MFLRRCAVSAVRRGSLLPRATAAQALTALPTRTVSAAPGVLATRRGLSLLAGESPPPSIARAPEAASLENTYIMGIEPELLEGQPEMVRRMFMLLNGRRKDLTKAQKRDAVLRHRQFVDDTGSPEVQAAVLSRGIHAMSAHLSANKKDNNCKRILTRLIHRRRKVLQHLYRLSPKRYFQVRHRPSPCRFPPCAPLPLPVLVRVRCVQSSDPFCYCRATLTEPLQALEDLGLRQTVAPPPQPTYNTKFDVYRCRHPNDLAGRLAITRLICWHAMAG